MNSTHKLGLNKVGAKYLATRAAWTESEREEDEIERLRAALDAIASGPPFTETEVRGWAEAALAPYGGRSIVHTRAGGIGADWDLDDVLTFLDAADEVGFGLSLMGHEMYAVKGERQVNFEVCAPRTDQAVAEVEAVGGWDA